MPKLRILLADDHAAVRDGLRMIINAQPDMEVVGEAADGSEAIAQTRVLCPDVLVLDVSMPHLNGLKAAEALSQESGVKIVMLTRHAESGSVQQFLRAGASGYVLKQSSSAELLAAIRQVALGGYFLDAALAGEVIRAYTRKNSGRVHGEMAEELTVREVEVVRLIAAGHSNKEVARRLEVSVKTVETHKANAMQKLRLLERSDLVRFAMLQGWLDEM